MQKKYSEDILFWGFSGADHVRAFFQQLASYMLVQPQVWMLAREEEKAFNLTSEIV